MASPRRAMAGAAVAVVRSAGCVSGWGSTRSLLASDVVEQVAQGEGAPPPCSQVAE